MMSPFFLSIVVLATLQNYVKSEDVCEDRNVIGAVGGAITLNVRYTEVRKMIWSFGKSGSIATTRPGVPIEIDNNRYKGRLRSTSDGYLIITELRLEDGGEYRVQFITVRETLHCNYHLTVFSNLTAEDVAISSHVTDNKTCEVSLACSVNGSNVTVTWRSVNSSDISRTQNVVFVPPSNINFIYICTAKNPVSDVSKAVHPWEYCEREKSSNYTTMVDYTRVNLIRLVISGCVLLISCCIFIHHMKTEVITQRPRADVI